MLGRVVRKRAGFSSVFLMCLIPFIFNALAVATRIVYEFVELSSVVAERKNERLVTRRVLNEIIDTLDTDAISREVIIDPNISQLLIASNVRDTVFGSLEIQIYSMNYSLFSCLDVRNFPPSKKSQFGEINVFIRATRRTSGVLAYRTEVAAEFRNDKANILWWREFVFN